MQLDSSSELGYIACGRWGLCSSAFLVVVMTHWIDFAQYRIRSCFWAVHPSPCLHIHLGTHAGSVPCPVRSSLCDGLDDLVHPLQEGHLHAFCILLVPQLQQLSVCLFGISLVIEEGAGSLEQPHTWIRFV